ncbi:acyl carrier protein [Polaribacter litorisediminis]|uniref:acyl carrier protein n=1 Tax=Polaribacter litorisediminis TaxID=1908341 RepID=UPI001CC18F94|nr:acyl carrier protein [Polaribacter litorisediminis]UAM96590.1 acyl carrier protein [Polaribacter litorisediminis]
METKFIDMITEVLEIEDRTIEMQDVFRAYDEWDSLAHLSLIAEIDDVYDVVIEDETFQQLTTLQALYTEIQKRTKD